MSAAIFLTLLGVVINVFEAVDVITLIKGGTYDELSLSVGEALSKRSDVSWPIERLGSSSLYTTGFSWHLYLLN